MRVLFSAYKNVESFYTGRINTFLCLWHIIGLFILLFMASPLKRAGTSMLGVIVHIGDKLHKTTSLPTSIKLDCHSRK